MTDEHAKTETGEWVPSATLAGTNEVEILAGVGERLNAAGVSLVRVGENMRLGVGEGITASWTTDAPEGFPNPQVEWLAGIMPALTLAFVLRTAQRDARALDAAAAMRERIAASAREPRPLRDERHRPTTGVVHAGSGLALTGGRRRAGPLPFPAIARSPTA